MHTFQLLPYVQAQVRGQARTQAQLQLQLQSSTITGASAITTNCNHDGKRSHTGICNDNNNHHNNSKTTTTITTTTTPKTTTTTMTTTTTITLTGSACITASKCTSTSMSTSTPETHALRQSCAQACLLGPQKWVRHWAEIAWNVASVGKRKRANQHLHAHQTVLFGMAEDTVAAPSLFADIFCHLKDTPDRKPFPSPERGQLSVGRGWFEV